MSDFEKRIRMTAHEDACYERITARAIDLADEARRSSWTLTQVIAVVFEAWIESYGKSLDLAKYEVEQIRKKHERRD